MSSTKGNSSSATPASLTPAQQDLLEKTLLREVINAIPDENAYVGKRLLLKILEARGPAGVEAFAEKMRIAADNKAVPQFDALEKQALKSLSLNVMRRASEGNCNLCQRARMPYRLARQDDNLMT